MDWGSPEPELNEIDKFLTQQRANQALAGIVGRMLQDAGQMQLDPNSPTFGDEAAQKQARMGEMLINSLQGSPDLGYLPIKEVGDLGNTAYKLTQSPLDWKMKEFERNRAKVDLKEKEIQGRKDLQAQAAADRLKLEAERATKIRELKQLRDTGVISDEQFKAGVLTMYGLQAPAKAPPGPVQTFEEVSQWPPEKQRAYYQHLERTNPKAFTIQTGQPPTSLKEFEAAKNNPEFAAFLEKFKTQPGAVKPATRADKARAETFQNTIMRDPNNYELSDDDINTALQTKLLPKGARLRPEALDRINAMREEAGLTPLVETPKTYKTSRAIGGFSIPGTGGEETEYRYPAARNAPAITAPTGPKGYQSPEDVREAYRTGKLSKDQAASILRKSFGMK